MKYRFINEFYRREFEQFTIEADTLDEAWRQYRDRYDTNLIDEAEILDDWGKVVSDYELVEVLDENDKNVMEEIDAWLKDHLEEAEE